MSSGSIRIIQLPEKSSVNTDDYMAVDSSANGTKKVKFTDLLDSNLSAQNKAADASATGQAISELNTDINTEALARQSTDNSLQAQINQLVAPSGTAPNPAEIKNARIGADGVTYDTLGNAIRTQFTNVKSDIFDDIPLDISTISRSYINSYGVLSSASACHRTTMIDIQNYNKIVTHFENNDSGISGVAFYSIQDDYTSKSRVSLVGNVHSGDVITIPNSAKYVVFSALSSVTFSANGRKSVLAEMQIDSEKASADIQKLKSYFGSNGILNQNSDIWTKSAGYYASSAGLVANAGYDSYYFVADDSLEIYSDGASGNGYYSITLFANGTISDGNYINRYRKSDNNLPTESSPLSVNANDVIVISVYTTDIGFTLNTNLDYNIFMANNIGLGRKQIAEVTAIANIKRCKIKYETGSFAQGATERLCIYVPSSAGYILYVLLHCANLENNADSWHIYRAISVDDELNIITELTTDGEWECALLLNGRNDYSGGYAHGDEVYTSISIICDGEFKTLAELASTTDCCTIEILETSSMYDPADSETVVAEHGRRYVFDMDGLVIHQTLKWLYTGGILDCYMAMFPASKAVTDTYYLDNTYNPTAIPSSPNLFFNDIEYSAVYKESAGFRAEISVPIYPSGYVGSGVFSVRDNNGGNYNKMYYQISTSGDSVNNGDVWKSKSVYKLTLA